METLCPNIKKSVSHNNADKWVRDLFDRVDAMDTQGWLEYLSDDAKFYFGTAPPAEGKRAIGETVDAFFSSLSAIEHKIVESWATPDAVLCRGQVRYTRPDGSTLGVPFANVLKLDDRGLIHEYLIDADISKL